MLLYALKPLILVTGKINDTLSENAITILGKEKLVLFACCKQFNVFVNRISETQAKKNVEWQWKWSS